MAARHGAAQTTSTEYARQVDHSKDELLIQENAIHLTSSIPLNVGVQISREAHTCHVPIVLREDANAQGFTLAAT